MPSRETFLSALTHVEATARGWIATGPEPWLRCDGLPATGWLRLEYSCGLADPLTRPVLRVVGRYEVHDEYLPAAEAGRAVWIGRLPEGVREVWISPTLRQGPFAFRIERCEALTRVGAVAEIGRRHPGRACRYVWGRARGFEDFARLQARRTLGATPLSDYDGWRRARARAFEPHFDGRSLTAPSIRIHVVAPDAAAAAALKPALEAQIWPHWSLAVGDADPEDGDFVLRLSAGDRLAPHALAEGAARASEAQAICVDEDAYDPTTGRLGAPRLRPDWSPIFAAGGYAGGSLALRGSAWRAGGFDPSAEVVKLRRVLVSRRDPPPLAEPGAPPPLTLRRRASVIVPTRDRLDLLRACVESLDRFDPGAECELIVVDNGSAAAEALAYLSALEARAKVLRRPGPFNFSALANAGARAARAPFLLFLNDDVEALGPEWLGRMLEWAAAPQVGAVGAKLLYPDGRVQHAGVVLGLDGASGHVQRLASADDPGYLGSLVWPREVSAVTGACLAVEAAKFQAVGGFDEARLPVEFSDIDLCLRLAERGFGAVCEPRAQLMHRESATRGVNLWLDSRYADEHATFRTRWARRLRDDPYFHPALSLDALDIALG